MILWVVPLQALGHDALLRAKTGFITVAIYGLLEYTPWYENDTKFFLGISSLFYVDGKLKKGYQTQRDQKRDP